MFLLLKTPSKFLLEVCQLSSQVVNLSYVKQITKITINKTPPVTFVSCIF